MKKMSILLIGVMLFSAAGTARAATFLDFEDIPMPSPPGTYSQTGLNWFVTSGVKITLDTFYWNPTGSTSTGPGANGDDSVFVSLPTQNYAGGTGIAMHTNNVNLVILDPEIQNAPMDSISFLWGEYGGNVNLEVNGDLFRDEDFTLLGPTLGGATISVVSFGPTPDPGGELGQVTVTGAIQSFKIGGQELWIDNIEGIPEFPPPPPPPTETHGTLVANDGDDILDSELEKLIKEHIGDQAGVDYESMILAFTECYGGDKFDDFAGYDNTALLSGSQAGNTSQYGGYHRGLAGSLVPGTTTDAAHAAAAGSAAAGDSPVKAGDNLNVGGSESTHVLVWAGKPNSLDQDDIDDIHDNFDGQPNTTVTVLSGDGTGNNVDGAATRENLEDALDDIGDQMNENEQFILFVTDHGDLDDVAIAVFCPGEFEIFLGAPAYADMLADLLNQPQLSLITKEPIDPSIFQSVSINGSELPLPPVVYVLDNDNDGEPDQYKFTLLVDESLVLPEGNAIFVMTSDSVSFDMVSLESGAISKLPKVVEPPAVSEWGLIVMAALLLTAGTIVIIRQRKQIAA